MNRNVLLGIIVIVIIILFGFWYFKHAANTTVPTTVPNTATTHATTTSQRMHVASVVYKCDKGHTIAADFYNDPSLAQPVVAGQPPHPTGSVEVSIDGAVTTTLAQTISADGARYATPNESLVFWSKGNTALIMRNNAMDLNYTNCTVSK